jgi:hypothetical protein
MFSIGKENSVAGKSTKADHYQPKAHQIAAHATSLTSFQSRTRHQNGTLPNRFQGTKSIVINELLMHRGVQAKSRKAP